MRSVGQRVATVLPEQVWRPVAEAHRQRVEELPADRAQQRRRGLSHPVEDFLFDYYERRPSHLARWHPGLEGAEDRAG